MATNLFFSRQVLKKHATPTRSAPVSVVCCGCRLRVRVLLHQATDTRVRLLDATDIEYHVFEHQHFPGQDCSRLDHRRCLWCERQHALSASCRPRIKLSSFIAVETPNPISLSVSLCLFDSALTKPKRVSLRSATSRYSDPLQAIGNVPVRSTQTSLPAPAVSPSSCRGCCRPLIFMDVHIAHPGSNSR